MAVHSSYTGSDHTPHNIKQQEHCIHLAQMHTECFPTASMTLAENLFPARRVIL